MFGLAILFGLFVWIVVTLIAMTIVYKIGKQINYPKTGMVVGFMLTFGYWAIKWGIQDIEAQREAEKMCKKAGITLYIQPEKWKEMLGGEEAWREIKYKSKTWSELTHEDKKKISQYINFEGLRYEFSFQYNKYISSYELEESQNIKYGMVFNTIYFDTRMHSPLFKRVLYIPSRASLNNGFMALFFRGGKECPSEYDPFKDFIYTQEN